MLLELAKPVSLLLCLYSLLVVFHTAFLTPGGDLLDKGMNAFLLLSFSAGITLASGMIFWEAGKADKSSRPSHFAPPRRASHRGLHLVALPDSQKGRSFPSLVTLSRTLPLQVFYWAASVMAVMFLLSWYWETYYLPYKDLRP